MTTSAISAPSFTEILAEALHRSPHRVAFVSGDRELTYAATADLTSRIQQVLASQGVRQHSGVAVLSPNVPETWMCQTATFLLGARYSGLHPLGSASDHTYLCDLAEVDVLVVHPDYADIGAEIVAKSDTISKVFSLGPSDLAEDLLASTTEVAARRLTPGPAQAEDVAWLQFTGGTTGQPKAVMLPHRGLAQAAFSITSWGVPQDPRYLLAAPITHAGSLPILPVLIRGGTVILQQGFDSDVFLHGLQHHRANYGFVVPTMLYSLLDNPNLDRYDHSSLETLTYGAAPCSPVRLAEALDVFGQILVQGYGQTESLGIATSLLRHEHDATRFPQLLGSCGRPVMGATVDILDDDSLPVDNGTVGELCVRSPAVMSGYWKQPVLSAHTLRNGWLHTGDLARRDDNGYFYIVDRNKDMIITGGFNVYPREIEDVLCTDPAVSSVAVVGIPDDRWGESVTAFIVPKPGAIPDPEHLRHLVRDAKGAHQAPKTIKIVEALPLTNVGKIDKKALRATNSPSPTAAPRTNTGKTV